MLRVPAQERDSWRHDASHADQFWFRPCGEHHAAQQGLESCDRLLDFLRFRATGDICGGVALATPGMARRHHLWDDYIHGGNSPTTIARIASIYPTSQRRHRRRATGPETPIQTTQFRPTLRSE
eukprot:CAMPEP_0206299158 /NCGR_PEP_ID=MMETSP0106_2-20121207/7049_1 /ASSEMBLY_ACC=CAM_ASM_000206 /TAXON_ID=81532 /ORGANISM="Acanthoeca-like sp., Strain 10tr" /LENGTH=123 /DNA_ID=CAMNT_0053729857 /DNA_START=1296 /DNA_END=1664 /DNA_ORIENTATION=+